MGYVSNNKRTLVLGRNGWYDEHLNTPKSVPRAPTQSSQKSMGVMIETEDVGVAATALNPASRRNRRQARGLEALHQSFFTLYARAPRRAHGLVR